MSTVNRRNFLLASPTLPFAADQAPRGDSGAASSQFAPAVSGREVMQRRFFPNVVLTTHEGKSVRFYDDLLKDKIVVINLMYATCTGVCPTITSHLVTAKKLLGDRVGRDVFFYSITIKPEEDTSQKLKEYAEMHNAGPGWLFLTGKPEDIELLRRKLGYVDSDPEVDKDKSRHSGMVRYGNEPLSLWGACQGSAKPEWIAEEISFVIPKETAHPASGHKPKATG
jgi:protein SCO1/2